MVLCLWGFFDHDMVKDGDKTSIKAGAWRSLDTGKPEELGWGGCSDTGSVPDSLPDPKQILHLSTPQLCRQ